MNRYEKPKGREDILEIKCKSLNNWFKSNKNNFKKDQTILSFQNN